MMPSLHIAATKVYLQKTFDIKDLGELRYFLGIEVFRCKYTLDLLRDTGKLGAKPARTPLEANYKDTSDSSPFPDIERFRRVVGKLIYLTLTRPDLSFAVHQVSQWMHAPTLHHWHMVDRILRYLKGLPGMGIWMHNNQHTEIVGYYDADWARDKADRKSTTGYCTFVGGNLVTWRSKKQTVVARSSAEAEYRAMANTTSEIIWLKTLLGELRLDSTSPVTLHCDNQAAIHIATNPVFHERTKHIEVDCHFIREKILQGIISLSYTKSTDQLAYIFTKATSTDVLHYLVGKLGMHDFYMPSLRGNIGGDIYERGNSDLNKSGQHEDLGHKDLGLTKDKDDGPDDVDPNAQGASSSSFQP
ncbi:PREDICTED: uncharacterized protein LOC109116727 [Tarenaya hassleriana]|uniref:uncharacterized protein LOC109116727 n=1 Tax=Tarenaya hassleriana TaxID=28532 RepID=UPI0008FD6704|nr:PREDICTED: uncharacterized protein LOC109116727 [Tarenaya hassleriana]